MYSFSPSPEKHNRTHTSLDKWKFFPIKSQVHSSTFDLGALLWRASTKSEMSTTNCHFMEAPQGRKQQQCKRSGCEVTCGSIQAGRLFFIPMYLNETCTDGDYFLHLHHLSTSFTSKYITNNRYVQKCFWISKLCYMQNLLHMTEKEKVRRRKGFQTKDFGGFLSKR